MNHSYRSLLGWMDRASTTRGIHFARKNETWDFWSYERLSELARQIARSLLAAGLCDDDVISIVQQTGPEFVATFFGTLLAGGTPSPIAPPLAFQAPGAYEAHVSSLVATAQSTLLVAEPEFQPELRRALAGSRTLVTSVDELIARAGPGQEVRPPGRARYALLQFTSGSSGTARGVCVPYAALEANIEALHCWLQWSEQDSMAAWLPVHHDMGLIGCMLWPVVSGNDLWLLKPEQFLRRPLSYLRCFAERGATIGAIPPFGLDYLVRCVRPSALRGLDFSGWKGIVIGAERIEPRSCERFLELLEPFGLSPKALLPAYGLAENTLAATGVPPYRGLCSREVAVHALSLGSNALDASNGGERVRIVGCGVPVDKTFVTIVDESGAAAAEGVVGEIMIEGLSVAERYIETVESASLTSLKEGRLRSGDAGFIIDRELFVLGRIGDSLKLRGRVLFAEDLEIALNDLGIPRQRFAVLLGNRAGVATVVALLEHTRGPLTASVEQVLQQRSEGAVIVLWFAPPGTIVRTSSGKPKRRLLWKQFSEGTLAATQEPLPPAQAAL